MSARDRVKEDVLPYSIIIPIMDEPYIQALISEIHSRLDQSDINGYEIVVVDASHSPLRLQDDENVKCIRQTTRGLGNAILEGVHVSRGQYIVTMDGDGSHDPLYIPHFLHLAKDFDIVTGSKYGGGGTDGNPQYRGLMSRVANTLSKTLLGLDNFDAMTGFSAVKREVYDHTQLNPFGYKIVLELMFKNKTRSHIEIPIKFRQRMSGVSKFGKAEFLKTGLFVLKLYFGSFWNLALAIVLPILLYLILSVLSREHL